LRKFYFFGQRKIDLITVVAEGGGWTLGQLLDELGEEVKVGRAQTGHCVHGANKKPETKN
jgi:hypothetical protein